MPRTGAETAAVMVVGMAAATVAETEVGTVEAMDEEANPDRPARPSAPWRQGRRPTRSTPRFPLSASVTSAA
ncbi:MAG: hypothetical protein H5U01_05910 [Clostridia bacterium]|nr:hypothetical protein [Clostridia bacterium]